MVSCATQIKGYLSSVPIGNPFPSNALRHLATTDNLRQVLNRLVKEGQLKRLARGLFVKIEASKVNSKNLQGNIETTTTPSSQKTLQALTALTAETIAVHGAEAARQLKLSTQMPMRPVFYTSGNTRTIKLAGKTIMLRHANPSKLVLSGTLSGLVIAALNYLGKHQVNENTVKHIDKQIGQKQFTELLTKIAHMPPWMAEIFFHYQHRLKKKGT